MIKAIVIDDEQHCIDRLQNLVHHYLSNEIEWLAFCTTVEEGLDKINSQKPDLVFLDVQIKDKTAFDLLQQLPKINFGLIFTTAYDQYAVQAFKYSAIDYLLKPIDRDDLLVAVSKLSDKITQKEHAEKLEILFYNMVQGNSKPKKICVPTLNGFHFLNVEDIIRCQADINYTHLFLKDRQKITVAKPLKEFEELLAIHLFYRVHNSHLVNLEYVKSYYRGKGGHVQLLDNTEIEVSSRRKEGFLKKLKEI